MTNITPQQMRALADERPWMSSRRIDEARAALRAAADSVEQWIRVAARLSDRIDDAPHDSFCVADLPSGKHECICWKANAS